MQQDFTFDETTLDDNQSSNRYAMDDKLHLTFYVRPVLNAVKSEAAGRPVYDEVDYVKVYTPGSQLSVIDAPMTAGTYMKRFGERYRKWKAGQAELISGTPIDAFPFLIGKVGLVAELRSMHVHTVEQLADMADNHLQNFMGGQELRRKAQDYIKGTVGTDAVLADLKKKNEALQAQVANLTNLFGAKEHSVKKEKVS